MAKSYIVQVYDLEEVNQDMKVLPESVDKRIKISWNKICLGRVGERTFWKRLDDVFMVTVSCLPRRLEEVLMISLKTS